MDPVYLDYNATTPVDRAVLEAMLPYFESRFGNPSSVHAYGTATKRAVETAREQVAALLKCEPREVIFTSGGTESNNFAIRGAAWAMRNEGRGNHIITSAVEHPAVIEVCNHLKAHGFEVTVLPVDGGGRIDPVEFERAIRPTTVLASIMHANNEVGTIQPIREAAAIAARRHIRFHTDAAQSAGKIAIDTRDLGVDLLSIAGHKLYAPKGVGALFVRDGVSLEKLMYGADHERNLRAGTENVPYIVALGVACGRASQRLQENATHYAAMRDRLQRRLTEALPDVRINGDSRRRLPNTLSVSFRGVEANTVVSRLEGVAVSAGAACHADDVDLSPTLVAMHVPIEYAMGTIRCSTGRETTATDIDRAADEIISVVKVLMPESSDGDRSGEPLETGSTGNPVRLTRYTHGLGCACKIAPHQLEEILSSLPRGADSAILVGTETSDDATVYRLSDDTALVQSLDFFTPIVDDPYQFGVIAAANALSDIYAMGGRPLFAMNIVGFPVATLPLSVLHEILRGAGDTAAEAGISVVGGHTIEDPEPKYGMVVSGIVDPERIWRNRGARPGDSLVLTKAIGTGIVATGLKRGLVDDALRDEAVRLMGSLNRSAAEILQRHEVHACTDVTGFGLIGHLREMLVASGCGAEVVFSAVPRLAGAERLADAGIVPGGTRRNRNHAASAVDFGALSETRQMVLCDAQTSGGLLAAVPAADAEQIVQEMQSAGIGDAAVIGTVTAAEDGALRVRFS
jgi:cysteine desulfurase NifS/selenium donor protein